jgi:hypothetical protein
MALFASLLAVLLVGCGSEKGREAEVHGVPGKWEIWVPPSARVFYLRIKEPVTTGLGAPCPGEPWGIVNPYRIDRRGNVISPRGTRDPHARELRLALQHAHPASKPGWVKAYEQKNCLHRSVLSQ